MSGTTPDAYLTTPSSSASRLSLANASSASSTSSASSSQPSSSPLLSLSRKLAHVPNARALQALNYGYDQTPTRAPGGQFKHPQSRMLQLLSLTLDRLSKSCTFCWSMNFPSAGTHHFNACPMVANHAAVSIRDMYVDFRKGIKCQGSTCYGCYVPKVRAIASHPHCHADAVIDPLCRFQRPHLQARPQRSVGAALCLCRHSPSGCMLHVINRGAARTIPQVASVLLRIGLGHSGPKSIYRLALFRMQEGSSLDACPLPVEVYGSLARCTQTSLNVL